MKHEIRYKKTEFQRRLFASHILEHKLKINKPPSINLLDTSVRQLLKYSIQRSLLHNIHQRPKNYDGW